MPDKKAMNPTGLSDEECQEVHKLYMNGLVQFAAISAVVHVVVFAWQPWFAG